MTPVFGHGRLRLYLLKLLDESPRHGYEIIQQLRERFAGLYAPSAGTVYPRLARLESEGLVRHETDGGRKVYHITDAGRAELAAKAGELEALETEIRDSVDDLAEGIRDEVRESARTIREELEAEAREAASAAAQEAAAGSGERAGASAGAGTGARAGARAGAGPFGWRPSPPPAESKDWNREQWRDWKRQQQEQFHAWRRDFTGQREQWRDWQRAWKEQWARQWKEQWEEQSEARQRQQWGAPPWAWLFGGGSPLWGHDEPRDAPSGSGSGGSESGSGESGAGSGSGSGTRRGFEWDVFGPQLRDVFDRLRTEAGPLFEAARRHGPLSDAEQAEVRAVVDRAIAELRAIFERPGSGPDQPTDTF